MLLVSSAVLLRNYHLSHLPLHPATLTLTLSLSLSGFSVPRFFLSFTFHSPSSSPFFLSFLFFYSFFPPYATSPSLLSLFLLSPPSFTFLSPPSSFSFSFFFLFPLLVPLHQVFPSLSLSLFLVSPCCSLPASVQSSFCLSFIFTRSRPSWNVPGTDTMSRRVVSTYPVHVVSRIPDFSGPISRRRLQAERLSAIPGILVLDDSTNLQ